LCCEEKTGESGLLKWMVFMAEIEKNYLSADCYLRDIWQLAAKVRESGWRPDFILGLWRGGAPVAVAIHEFMKVTGWDVKHIPLKCTSYDGIEENSGEVKFTHGDVVFEMFRAGDRVLVVDDVFDTGKTAVAVKMRMETIGAEMRMACVYWKPEKNVTAMKPDYFVEDSGSGWIVFPHEMEGLSREEMARKDPFLARLLNRFPQDL
jgi:hypoxanthine phosphoribosyltransferase